MQTIALMRIPTPSSLHYARTHTHTKYLNLRFEVEAKTDNDGVAASAVL